MKRVVWLTDIHLNFLEADERDAFCRRVDAQDADAVLLGGDIAEAPSVVPCLRRMAARIRAPIHFVLGNHDYYTGSIAEVRAAMPPLCAEVDTLHWLPEAGVVELTPAVGLIGHGGWADGRIGSFLMAPNKINDYLLIEELADLAAGVRLTRLNELGDEAAAAVRRLLPAALARYPQVYFLTHVPPWREACVHKGKPSDDEWAPHFSCKAVGDAVLEIMADFPRRELTVLCGHTHGDGEHRMTDNVRVLTGGAEYTRPAVQRVFELDAQPARRLDVS